MHELSHSCDCSVPTHVFENLKPASFRNLSQRYVADTISAIIHDVDRFYNPKVLYRRRFTLDGVSKYAKLNKLHKNVTFLHNKLHRKTSNFGQVNAKKKKFNRSISMFETNSNNVILTNDLSNYKRFDDKYVAQDFITAERFANYMETGKTYFLKNINFKDNSKNKEARFKNRNSFPLISPTNNEQVSFRVNKIACFGIFICLI